MSHGFEATEMCVMSHGFNEASDVFNMHFVFPLSSTSRFDAYRGLYITTVKW